MAKTKTAKSEVSAKIKETTEPRFIISETDRTKVRQLAVRLRGGVDLLKARHADKDCPLSTCTCGLYVEAPLLFIEAALDEFEFFAFGDFGVAEGGAK